MSKNAYSWTFLMSLQNCVSLQISFCWTANELYCVTGHVLPYLWWLFIISEFSFCALNNK